MELDIVHHASEGDQTEVGSYFVANYPPFSAWSADHVPAALDMLNRPADKGSATPLGLYLHIPFCRKRCKFCYFRVYTDKNARDIEDYVEALSQEAAIYAERPAIAGRSLDYVYFGGGTPSYLSAEQLTRLVDSLRTHWRWDDAREVTFECEPGTLRKGKLEAIRDIGVTRLSLGVEHFDDDVLVLGGRAHKSDEIFRSYEWAREVGFDQINIDLIAGMEGDTDKKWEDTVDKALALAPDNVTIYQMELPHNTTLAQEAKQSGSTAPIATWARKRAWVNHAFNVFESAGYQVSGAYTLVKPSAKAEFIYRDALWHGADMVGLGVASFSHVSGVHFQNADMWDEYVGPLSDRGALPIARALPMTDRQRLIRELILQLKMGHISAAYFRDKFDTDILDVFAEPLRSMVDDSFAEIDGDEVRLTRAGLLCVDQLLSRFFEPQYRNVRYT